MFFYLSQFLSILVMPLSICLILIIYGLIRARKQQGNGILIFGIVLLLIFSNQFLSNLAMNIWEPEIKEFAGLPEYEIGIVLTGVTNLNKTVGDRTLFNKGADRATHAVQLYKLGKVKKVLITGGQGLNPTNQNPEAVLLRDFMIVAGVEETDIILEDKAKNTHQNAAFSKEILNQMGISESQKHLLITSAFHMYRSKGCFDKVGLNTDTFPVDYYSNDSKFDLPTLLYPDPYSIYIWQKLFKEWVGIVMYKVAGYL
ncbi:YdcF family protein [Belliella sp. R4-6]|uniref:YdcF family protein n=1 Tax=Belliella alkalica TaxID=1730871 RepID=A0ABS9VDZ9_9BACT|nr:YdcF family protein [Belliella alkalica]MCH7414665.1 YdcF family protein [Belliella alkalica]